MGNFYKASCDLVERQDVSDAQKIMLMVLESMQQQKGYCYATNEALAQRLGWSDRKVRRVISELNEMGEVECTYVNNRDRNITVVQGGQNTSGGQNEPRGQNSTQGGQDRPCKVDNIGREGGQFYPPLYNREDNRSLNRELNRLGDQPDEDTSNEDTSQKPKAKRFKPPTEIEVQAFFQTTDLPDQWEAFFDYYTSNGWKAGRNPMKDWHAAARGWVRRQKQFMNEKSQKTQRNGQSNTESIMRGVANSIINDGWDVTQG